MFSQVSVHSHRGILQFQVLSQVSGPRFFTGGTTVPGSFPHLWSQVLSQGVPQSQVLSWVSGPSSFLGVPQSWPEGSEDWSTPSQDRTGVPPPPPRTEQQSKYLLCSGWYASCGHAGGLSCFYFVKILVTTSLIRISQIVSTAINPMLNF